MTTNTICPLPFIHLATHPEGKATLCCISDHTNNMSAARDENNKVLNLNKDSIIEIVNSSYFKKIRQEMILGEKPVACMRCYREEEKIGDSKRLQELKRFTFQPKIEIEPKFKFVELRLGNICNLKCRTCNPYSSSNWVPEYNKMQSELKFVTKYNDGLNFSWIESEIFWKELLNYSEDLDLIYINGGEPTLVKKHWSYLERLTDKKLNEKVTLWYNINMTNVPDELISIWKNFKKVIVHASIDDLFERNLYLRKGSDWNDVKNNLIKLKEYSWLDLSITQTVSWLNIYYVSEFKEYFDNMGVSSHINLVHEPNFLSPNVISKEAKEKLILKLKKYDCFKNLMVNILDDSNEDLFKKGLQYNKWLDKNRNENYSSIFSEWASILKYDD